MRLCDPNPGNRLTLLGCCHTDMKDQDLLKVIKIYFEPICNGSNPVKNRREKQKTPRSGQEHIIYSQTI